MRPGPSVPIRARLPGLARNRACPGQAGARGSVDGRIREVNAAPARPTKRRRELGQETEYDQFLVSII